MVERRFEFGVGDVDAVVGLGGKVERPDLHGRNPLGEKILRQLVGAMQEAVEIVVLALVRGRGPNSTVRLSKIARACRPMPAQVL